MTAEPWPDGVTLTCAHADGEFLTVYYVNDAVRAREIAADRAGWSSVVHETTLSVVDLCPDHAPAGAVPVPEETETDAH